MLWGVLQKHLVFIISSSNPLSITFNALELFVPLLNSLSSYRCAYTIPFVVSKSEMFGGAQQLCYNEAFSQFVLFTHKWLNILFLLADWCPKSNACYGCGYRDHSKIYLESVSFSVVSVKRFRVTFLSVIIFWLRNLLY